jgi:uncharacterized protein (DUF4415 family)
MHLKTKTGRLVEMPNDDTVIKARIVADPDTFKAIRHRAYKAKTGWKAKISGYERTQERITICLSPDVVAALETTGRVWQVRIDTALEEWIKEQSI